MTAVEIFFNDLVHLGYIEYPDECLVQDRLKLALELEKQQIIDAHLTGLFGPLEMEASVQAYEYYNETYKTKAE
jgi:hypothetical protein